MNTEPFLNPFTVLIDSQEKRPFLFRGLRCDADRDYRPLVVPTQFASLGVGGGDYSIAGYDALIRIERKSAEDLHGTILGWNPPGRAMADESEARSRRERFKAEVENLSKNFAYACIIVECSVGDAIRSCPATDTRDGPMNGKYLARTILSWKVDFPNVAWEFLDDRILAEIWCFRTLEKWWRKHRRAERQAAKERKERERHGLFDRNA